MGKGFGIAAIVVAVVAIIVPLHYSLMVSALALSLAALGALAGERPFAIATPIVAAVNLLFLSPIVFNALKDRPGFWVAVLGFLAAPIVAIALNSAGVLVIGVRR